MAASTTFMIDLAWKPQGVSLRGPRCSGWPTATEWERAVPGLFYAVLLVLGIVLLVVPVVRLSVGGLETGGRRVGLSRKTGARQILDERYAVGELSTEEYRHRLHVLEEWKP
jgi:putative membrane protein